ncbi:MAG: ATP-binding protein [Spirochaetota bacterium]
MGEQVIYLTTFDMIPLLDVIKSLPGKGCAIEEVEKPVLQFLSSRISVPLRFKTKLHFNSTPRDMTVTLTEKRLHDVRDGRHIASFSSETMTDEELRAHVERIHEGIKTRIPDEFISLEHLIAFLDKPLEMKVYTLPENLLLPALHVLDKLFAAYTPRGIVEYQTPEDSEKAASSLRIEVREKVYKYAEINSFRVYEKDGIVCAAGITKSENFDGRTRYFLTVYARRKDAETVQHIFDSCFEETLFGDLDLKGGKFTGDQRIIKLKEKVTMSDIVLEERARKEVMTEIFGFFGMKDAYRKANLPFKRGVALYGPPGTGKTMIAKIIATTLQETVIWVKAGDVNRSDDIDRIFRLARLGAPAVIILEDIDFFMKDRESGDDGKNIVPTIMSHLDGLEENDGILVVVTTNRIDNVEKAVVERPGRIDARIFLGELGRSCIIDLVTKKLSGLRTSFASFNDVIPEHTVMSGAMAVELSTCIMRNALKKGTSAEICIDDEDVKKALKEIERNQNRQKMLGFKTDE